MVPINTARHVFSAPVGSRFELTSARCQRSSCHSCQSCRSPFDTLPVRNSGVRVPSRKPKEDACHSISSKQAHKNHRDRIEEHSGASVAVSQNCSDKRLGRTSRLAYRFYFRCAPPSRATHHFLYHYLSCNYTTRGGIFIIGEQYVRTLYARRGGGNCRDCARHGSNGTRKKSGDPFAQGQNWQSGALPVLRGRRSLSSRCDGIPLPSLEGRQRLSLQGPGARKQDRETLDVRWAGPRLSLGRHEDMD